METIDLGEKSTKNPFWGLNERKTPLIIQFIEIGRGDYVRQQCKHSLKLYRKKKNKTRGVFENSHWAELILRLSVIKGNDNLLQIIRI